MAIVLLITNVMFLRNWQLRFRKAVCSSGSNIRVNGHLYSAVLWDEPIARDAQIWPMVARDHTVLPATHSQTIPLLPSHRASPGFGCYSLCYPWRDGQAELTWVTEVDFPASGVEPWTW